MATDGHKNEPVGRGSMALRLAVLSRGPRLYSTRRIVEEARKRNLRVDVCDPMKFSLMVMDGSVDVLHKGKPFSYDAIIPRIGHSITQHGVAVLRHIEQLGMWTANTSQGILQSRDKLHASQILARNRIPIPRTVYVRDILDVEQAIDAVGGLPVVVKVTQGTQGEGVFLRHTAFEVRNLVQGLLLTGKSVLVQEYIAESHGKDIRALVVGDRVVACMRRRARGREFRSNFHLNGTVENVQLPEDYAEAACRAARVLGLNIAGVDLLEGNDGPLVLEVNSSPGLEGIEKASGVNVAGAIIEYIMEDTAFREVDLDQLLRTVPGSGVLSLQLMNHPKMVGKRLHEVFASIPVFALSRGDRLVWNPDSDLQLRYDDVLVCYGELTELRSSLRQAMLGVPREALMFDDHANQSEV
ncbi:RimK family alpha-L-glutamate ligase [Candidatus Poseidonia alphae]|nr:RimK family alpha-L-glutamate ligase [Candidatus Poseidonia alphae]MDA8639262.1 RimK family alpha-L-glutamate ligase [Candidatus Poseidonia alphae]MDA8749814.1 RimK family alpha-L-glutamate ligase [Candidatus Poseidonia alphae]MDA8839187.1 RimK family alpha-L-glutamate ligase [Candidatus Poseidonia alphae]MDA9168236.1 RimK family alpha-L-glutamate ligase [Candidatus Poseidonia alphae]